MRIALVAPPWISVPPTAYGGVEWVVYLLADELVRNGHDVTLYATGDSTSRAEVVSFIDRAEPERLLDSGIDARHYGLVWQDLLARARAGTAPEIVHDHGAGLGPAFAHVLPMPVVYTHHNALDAQRRESFEPFLRDVRHVCVSEHQRSTWSALAEADVVPNAIDVAAYRWQQAKEDFLLSASRIHPTKGTHLAIEAARRAGRPIVLIGKIDAGEGERYFVEAVEPLLTDRDAIYLGQVPEAEKRDLMRRAAATLVPIMWDEPFGLVMVESMAAGTPCVVFRAGAAESIVVDGVTGFVVDGVDGMVEAIGRIGSIAAADCRRHAEQHYAPAVMTAGYLAVYERALASRLAVH